jgi:hypothetical protein
MLYFPSHRIKELAFILLITPGLSLLLLYDSSPCLSVAFSFYSSPLFLLLPLPRCYSDDGYVMLILGRIAIFSPSRRAVPALGRLNYSFSRPLPTIRCAISAAVSCSIDPHAVRRTPFRSLPRSRLPGHLRPSASSSLRRVAISSASRRTILPRRALRYAFFTRARARTHTPFPPLVRSVVTARRSSSSRPRPIIRPSVCRPGRAFTRPTRTGPSGSFLTSISSAVRLVADPHLRLRSPHSCSQEGGRGKHGGAHSERCQPVQVGASAFPSRRLGSPVC